MMNSEILLALWESTLAASIATLLVLTLGRFARRYLGAHAAYALWLSVPVAAGVVLLPAYPEHTGWVTIIPNMAPVGVTDGGVVAATSSLASLALCVWAIGALFTATVLLRRQRSFVSRLGALRLRSDGLWSAQTTLGLPAVVGVLRPRIVVPADFDLRYTPQERELIVHHERTHLRRGDLPANLLAAFLRCLHWFNPLIHIAGRRYRQDQELACDEWIIVRHPGARRRYCEAMLKTQLDDMPLPVGCHWPAQHPLKERITMLKRPTPSRARLSAALAFAFLSTAGMGYLAWTAQPAEAAVQPSAPATHDTPAGYGILAPPRYPTGSRSYGTVLMYVDIGADGSVVQVKLQRSSGFDDLDQAAMQAARDWRFTPATRAGQPVASRVRVPITFEPNHEAGVTDLQDGTDDVPALDALQIRKQ